VPESGNLKNAIAGRRDQMVRFAQDLVAIPTENPPGLGYPQAVARIQRELDALSLAHERIGDSVLSFAGSSERCIYFSGHYDVVPAERTSQFEPAVEGGNLFGRGSSDMKSGLAAMTYAAKALAEAGLLGNGRVGLVFVPDEETAGPSGSRRLAEAGVLGKNAIAMFTPEPTGGLIWNANRGAITLRITVQGKSAHVGRQFEGINAFEQMLSVCEPLARLKQQVEQRETQHTISPAAARRSILMLGGEVHSGRNFNVVPGSSSFTIDRRINPEEDFTEEKARLLAVVTEARASGIELKAEILQEGASSASPSDGVAARALAEAAKTITGREPRFELCPGLLETRFYAERGIPAYAYGPGLLTVSHGPCEFVPIDNIVHCAQIYALAAAALLALDH
jgi:succinyl-diaminopimelate desuccinylase